MRQPDSVALSKNALHIQDDKGEWDGPPTSGGPAWDNSGGNAGTVWDYCLYTRDAAWLAKAYPHFLAASEWIKVPPRRDHVGGCGLDSCRRRPYQAHAHRVQVPHRVDAPTRKLAQSRPRSATGQTPRNSPPESAIARAAPHSSSRMASRNLNLKRKHEDGIRNFDKVSEPNDSSRLESAALLPAPERSRAFLPRVLLPWFSERSPYMFRAHR